MRVPKLNFSDASLRILLNPRVVLRTLGERGGQEHITLSGVPAITLSVETNKDVAAIHLLKRNIDDLTGLDRLFCDQKIIIVSLMVKFIVFAN